MEMDMIWLSGLCLGKFCLQNMETFKAWGRDHAGGLHTEW